MKYLVILTILLGCKCGQRKVIVANNNIDTTKHVVIKNDIVSIDIHDPYETGKDTIRLNKIMDEIFNFPEVEATSNQINKASKGTHGVSIMVHDNFNKDTSYYHFMVGDNSNGEKYVNLFNFLLNKKTNEIKVYDTAVDSILSLQDWRKRRK